MFLRFFGFFQHMQQTLFCISEWFLAACGISLSGIINYGGLKISFDNGKPPLVLTI
jgi:hypothetical protein